MKSAEELVIESGGWTVDGAVKDVERLIALVHAEALEAAAQLCDPKETPIHAPPMFVNCKTVSAGAPEFAAAIRTLKGHP